MVVRDPMRASASHRGDERRLYRDLAWTWPIISPPRDYRTEAGEFRSRIRKHARIPVRTLLDLGCGGGHNDRWLRHDFEVTGVDVSPAMLRLARRLNPHVTYRLGDLRTVRLGTRFDAVVLADSVSYMLTERDLRRAFETAFAHLRPGGVFATYVEQSRGRFAEGLTHLSTRRRGDVRITLVERLHDPDPSDTTYESTLVYLIRRGGRLEVETDRHRLGIFPLATWIRLLRSVGFRPVRREVLPADGPDGRDVPMFVCTRPA